MSNVLPVILMVLPGYFIAVTIHELGHVIAGLFYGFKFLLFVIGPLGLKRNEQDKVVIYFEKNPMLWGGICAVLPKTEDDGNFMAFANVLIAGPLFALIFGAISLSLYFVFDRQFLLLVGAMSVAMSITALIPSRLGAFHSDGGRWVRIVKNSETRAVELALFNLVQSTTVHQSYAHINIADTQPLIAYEDHREQYIGHFYAMKHYKERGCRAMEEKHRLALKNLESKVPKSFLKLMTE